MAADLGGPDALKGMGAALGSALDHSYGYAARWRPGKHAGASRGKKKGRRRRKR